MAIARVWAWLILLGACSSDATVRRDSAPIGSAHYALDPSFGMGGVAIVEPGTTALAGVFELFYVRVARTPDGGLVISASLYISGSPPWPMLICRLAADGGLLTEFGGGCVRTVERTYGVARAVEPDPGGMLLVYDNSNSSPPAGVVQYIANGTRDTSFGGSGQLALGPVGAMGVRASVIVADPAGGHVVAGSLRLSGPPDQLWVQRIASGTAQAPVVIESSAEPIVVKVLRRTPTGFVIGGSIGNSATQTRIVRTDLAFAVQAQIDEPDCNLWDIGVLDNDDMILACANPLSAPRLRRIANGSHVDGFGAGTLTADPNCVLGLPDSLVFVGTNAMTGSATAPVLVSSETGELAGTIDPPALAGWRFREVFDAILLPDGSVVISGSATFGATGGVLRPFVARYIRSS